MNINGGTYEKLDDYLDGVLPEYERTALESALAEDAELRAELNALRGLRDDAARLPRDIAPEHDLWPEIAARLTGKDDSSAKTAVSFGRPDRSSRRSAPWGYLAAAAATLLFMLGAPMMLNRTHAPTTIAPPVTIVAALPEDAEFKAVAAEYVDARNQLAVLLAERRKDLAPETLAVVEENLTVIATAVSQIQTALAKDPESRDLERMLFTVYRSQVDLLQHAIQLADASAASNEADKAKGDSNESA